MSKPCEYCGCDPCDCDWGMNAKKEKGNIMNDFEVQEAEAINEALSRGHRNPRSDVDHLKMLEYERLDKEGNVTARFRLFIKEFDYISPDNITSDKNVRSDIVDKAWCQETLAPRLLSDGLILDPIMTTKKGKTESCRSGNNRIYSSKLNWRNKELPRFLLDDYWYPIELDSDGKEYFDIDNKMRDNFIDIVADVSTNPPAKSAGYTMASCAENLNKMFEADSTFAGINPNGEFPKRNDQDNIFDTICDCFLGGHYPRKGERTKIYNRWNNLGNTKSKTKAVDKDTVTRDLATAGWATGMDYKRRALLKPFWENYDDDNNVYVMNVTTNAKKIEEKILLSIIEKHHDGELTQNVGLAVHLTVDKPNPTLVGLNQQRKAGLKRLDRVNDILDNLNIPHQILMVMVAKQLVDPNDKMNIYNSTTDHSFEQEFINLNPQLEDKQSKQLSLVG